MQTNSRRKPRLNRKFRFQLLSKWITDSYMPCRVLDVGGGKGLLSYLLIVAGWEATIVDPSESLPFKKYKDIVEKKRVKVPEEIVKSIPRLVRTFDSSMVKDVDLVIGLHAHGANLQIIQACKKYKKDFLLMPCCVVDEPLIKQHGINWFDSLISYSKMQGFKVKIEKLNFKGKNRFLYSDKYLTAQPVSSLKQRCY